MKHRFCTKIHAITDQVHLAEGTSIPVIGWYSATDSTYYNMDQVEKLFESNQTENVYRDEDGKLGMRDCYLDFKVAFEIINGLILSVRDIPGIAELKDYARKTGLASVMPIPVEMHAGTKYLRIQDTDLDYDLFDMKYKVHPHKLLDAHSFVGEVCVGAINRLRNLTYRYIEIGGKEEQRHHFRCDSVSFDSGSRELLIKGIPEQSLTNEKFRECINQLDAELAIKANLFGNKMTLLRAVQRLYRDQGQYHLIGENQREYEIHSNRYWTNRGLIDN